VTLPTLAECLELVPAPGSPAHQLQAVDVWLQRRGDATISVGVVAVGASGLPERRCTVNVQGRTFEATRLGGGYATTWLAICAATAECERFENAEIARVR